MAEKNQASILEIIQKMVSDGESEDRIIQTLKDLGVDQGQAKRLLLIGQADTFALLRSEIAKIAKDDIEMQKPEMIRFISEEAEKSSLKSREKITALVLEDIQKYEKAITGQSKSFQEQMGDNVRKVTELSDRVKDALNELGTQVSQLRIDMDEMKISGIGSRNKMVGTLLIGLGIVFLLLDLYLIFSKFLPANALLTTDSLVVMVVMAMIGITMLFIATVS